MADWDESLHPRDKGGKFGSKGGHAAQIASAQPTGKVDKQDVEVTSDFKQPSVESMTGANDPRVASDPKLAATYNEAFEHNVGLFKEAAIYPNFRGKDFVGKSLKEQAQMVVEHMASNLQYFYEHTTDAVRERGKVWYDGAHKIAEQLSTEHGMAMPSAAGVIACLSPGKDWNQNVELARRVSDIYTSQQAHPFDEKMTAIVKDVWDTKSINKVEVTPERLKNKEFKASYDEKQASKAVLIASISGKTLGDLKGNPLAQAAWIKTYDVAHSPQNFHIFQPDGSLGPIAHNLDGKKESTLVWQSNAFVANAVRCIEAKGDRDKISPNIGDAHKVRSFYNNILDPRSPNGDNTIDTHMVGAALFRSLGQTSVPVNQNFGNSKPGSGNAMGSVKTGLSGTYGLYADATRLATERIGGGILPQQVQAVVWEAKKATLGETSKKADAEINQVWADYHAGKIGTQREAQDKLWSIATKDVAARDRGRVDDANKKAAKVAAKTEKATRAPKLI